MNRSDCFIGLVRTSEQWGGNEDKRKDCLIDIGGEWQRSHLSGAAMNAFPLI